MKQTYRLDEKIKQLLKILIPIMVTQLAMSAMSFADTVMSGQVSPVDLAGVAIGSSIWMPIFTGLNGILLAMTPIIAQLLGARNSDKIPFHVNQGIYLSIVISILIIVVGIFSLNPILNSMGLEPDVRNIAFKYLIALGVGIIPVFVYTVFRCFYDALGYTRVTMLITLISLPTNVLLNYVMIFGKFGFPMLGGVGAGIASAITYWIITFIGFKVIQKKESFASFRVFQNMPKVSFKAWKEILIIGVPIGFAIFFETSIFAAVTLLMSNFDTFTIAAHQAALNFASFLYMIPLSVSMALTILIGFEVGARRYRDARQYSFLGIGLALTIATLYSIILIFFNEQIARLYTKDFSVLLLTKQFLIYAIFFQLSDAVAAPIQGALRGYKDVNATFIMALISYWALGLPIGYALANFTQMGPFGYWIGLISGLAFGAIMLFIRLVRLQQRQLASQLEKSS